MTLGIRVTNTWCHPEFGGMKERTKTYPMDQAESATEMYMRWVKDDSLYSHTTISVFHLLEVSDE